MKKPVRYLIITFLVLAVACLSMVISPTFGRQAPFNEWAWKHHPVQKVRYYMSDSILEWLNKEQPSREVVLDKLGKEDFNADGSFQEATILCID